MSTRAHLSLLLSFLLSLWCEFGTPALAGQQEAPTWQSATLWYPTLADAGIALAEHVNQIDARCAVDIVPAIAANGMGPEGTVYGFTVSWACPSGASDEPAAVWLSNVLWYPTLADAGIALAEHVNQIDARCEVDIDPIVATGGVGPEGAVYAFAVAWACPSGASETPESAWLTLMLWNPTLAEAGTALAEHLNQIDAGCGLEVDSVHPASGTGPEGPVYAFLVTWAC